MAEKPPSTNNSTPFTKLESSEARNSATVAISSERPIFPRGIRDSNISFASLVRTSSCIGVAIGPGLSTFTRIFLPFSSLSHVRANERNAALLAAHAGHVPANQLDGLIERLLPPTRDENVGTFFNEALGARQRHAARSTRDYCNLTFKLSHNYSLWQICRIQY